LARTRVSRNSHLLTLAMALAFVLAAPAAGASGSKYRLQIVRAEGAGSCASAQWVQEDVTRRLGRNPFGDDGERGIEIVLERTDTLWRARLYLRIDPNEPEAARVIESDASDCSELGKSVSLAVALAIAPDLPPVEPKPAPPPEPPCPPEPPPAVVAPPPMPIPSSLHGEISARGLWSAGLLPRRSAGVELGVTFHGDLLGAHFGGFFYPEQRLRSGTAELGFGLTAAFASACLWARREQPAVWSCLGAQAGALHTVVYSPAPEGPGDRFWSAGSLELGIRQQVLGRLFVEAGALAVFPFTRHRFIIDEPSTPVYEQGAAAIEGFGGIGLRID